MVLKSIYTEEVRLMAETFVKYVQGLYIYRVRLKLLADIFSSLVTSSTYIFA